MRRFRAAAKVSQAAAGNINYTVSRKPCGRPIAAHGAGLAGRPIHLGRADTDGQTRVRIELAGAVSLPMVDQVIVQLGVQHLSIHL